MLNDQLKGNRAHSSVFAIQLFECALVVALFILSFVFSGKLIYNNTFPFGWIDGTLMYIMMSSVAIIILGANKYFSFLSRSFSESAAKLIGLVVIMNFIFIALLYFSRSIRLSPYYFVVADTFQILSLILIKRFSALLKAGILKSRVSLVIGMNQDKNELIRELRKQGSGRLAFVSFDDEKLEDYLDKADNIYLTGILSKKMKDRIISYCVLRDKKVFIVPETYEIAMRKSEMTQVGDIPLFSIESFRLTEAQNIIKRMMDIVLSVIGILLTSPIMLIAAIRIKLEDGGPVFFRQVRSGLNGKEFEVIKFRSMIIDAEKNTGAIFAVENDPRITRAGHWMRAARIDEIPQFFNVLAGDMSFIGPRPERPQFVEAFSKDLPEYNNRLAVKPGITGLAQVMGNYTTSAENKVKFDLVYIRDYSLLLDIKILLKTVQVVFTKSQSKGFSVQANEAVYNLEAELALEGGQFGSARRPYREHRFGKVVLVLFCSLIIILGCTVLRYSALTTAMLEAAVQPVTAEAATQSTSVADSQSGSGAEPTEKSSDSTPTAAIATISSQSDVESTTAGESAGEKADLLLSSKGSRGTEIERVTQAATQKPATGEKAAPNGAVVLSQEEINAAMDKMALGQKLSIAVDLISRLSAEDLMILDKLAEGGFTAEEKKTAKSIMYRYFNDSEVENIKEIYWEYVEQGENGIQY